MFVKSAVKVIAVGVAVSAGFSNRAEAVVVYSNNFNQPDGNVDSTPVAGETGGLLSSNVLIHSQQVVQTITGGQLGLQNVSYSQTTSVRFNDSSKPNTGDATNLWNFASGTTGSLIAANGA